MIVVWRVTERCNLRCRFCGYDCGLDRRRLEANPKQLSAFGEVLARYRQQTGERVLVSWLGGEPLLWPDLPAMTRRFVQDFGLEVSATTNGTPLSSSVVRTHIVTHYSELTVSVDGLAPTHDAIRRWRGGYQTIRTAIKALAAEKRSARRDLRLRANMVLTRDNITQVFDLAEDLAEIGFDEMTFNQLGGRYRRGYYERHRLLPIQADWVAKQLPVQRSRLADRGIVLCGDSDYLERLRASSRDLALRPTGCQPGEEVLFVEADGRVGPCCDTVESCGVPVATVDSVAALRRLPRVLARAVAQRSPRDCQDCTNTRGFRKFVSGAPILKREEPVLEASP